MNSKINKMMLIIIILTSLLLVISSCHQQNGAATPESTLTVATTLRPVSSPENDMAECKKINPNQAPTQANYQGVYPGRTKKDEVTNLLGVPLRTYDLAETSWEYKNLSVIFDGSIASELSVAGDGQISLEDMIYQYGCPEAIYALDVNEESYGEFSRLLFIYPHIGLDFTIEGYPTKLREPVNDISYFIPGSLKDYSENVYSLDNPSRAKLLTWEEAVN